MTEAIEEDRALLNDIIAEGGSRYTSGAVDRRKYERLEKRGWLGHHCPNLSDVVYEVTADGQAAAEAA
jgi:hypothetical protein